MTLGGEPSRSLPLSLRFLDYRRTQTMSKYIFRAFTCLCMTGAIAIPAVAQQDGNQNRSDDRSDRQSQQASDQQQDNRGRATSNDQQRSDRQQSQRRQQQMDRQQRERQQARRDRSGDQQSRNQQSRNQQRVRLVPESWVGVAYDYDNDGAYDHVDYLYYYDLQVAQEQSDRRARDRQRQRGSQGRQQARSGDRRNRQQVRLQGEITNMGIRGLTLGDSGQSDSKQRFAKVRTDSGRSARVCLGPEEKVAELDLQQGDRVTIEGVRGRVDDKSVVLARRVSSQGNSITVQLPRRERWQRVSGEIRDVRSAKGDSRNKRHTVVEVRTDRGSRQVDLGPESELQSLDLQEGDKISVLARQGRIGGQSMLIAQKVRSQDQTVDVREATSRSFGQARRNGEGRSQSRR
jgi:antitoxin component of MazEF toxin-antitoxin module